MEVGLLVGQNVNILLPTRGDRDQRVNDLRVWRTLLGETGYVLEGHHPNIWKSDKKARLQVLQKVAKKDTHFSEALFPDLSDMPLEIPHSCPNCKDCRQCQYKVCNMTYHEKKELEALKKSVDLDPLNDVIHASYPEINPELEFKNNKWQVTAMGLSLEKTLNKAGIMETYNA